MHNAFLFISLPLLHDHDVKRRNFTFCEGREQKATTFFFFFWTLIQSFRIQLQKKNCQDFTNWARWNKRDKVWRSATSLFKWRSRSRRCCCCLNSLTTSIDFKQKFLWRTALKKWLRTRWLPWSKNLHSYRYSFDFSGNALNRILPVDLHNFLRRRIHGFKGDWRIALGRFGKAHHEALLNLESLRGIVITWYNDDVFTGLVQNLQWYVVGSNRGSTYKKLLHYLLLSFG